MVTTKFKEKPMMLTSHNLQALKLKKKLEALPKEKLTDVQRQFLANEKSEADMGGMITIRDIQEEKRRKAEEAEAERKAAKDRADIEAAAEKLLAERKAKADAGKKVTVPKVKSGKAKK